MGAEQQFSSEQVIVGLTDSAADVGRSPEFHDDPPDPEASPHDQLMKQRIRASLFDRQRTIKIGRFVLLERLGAGTMGEVYAAYDEQLDRKVAVKVLHHHRHTSVTARQRLLREAKTLAQLSHPNVVQVYDGGEHEDKVFVAMEFVRGETLKSWLERRNAQTKPNDWRVVLDVFLDAGRGLQAAHEAGLMHRDFKPDNVLVGEDGRVRVVDFGLARLEHNRTRATPGDRDGATPDDDHIATPDDGGIDVIDGAMDPFGSTLETLSVEPVEGDASAASPAPSGISTLTVTGTVMGTPAYMSPEQMRAERIDARTDQFSFCVALYQALFGVRPFAGDSPTALVDSIEGASLAAPVTGAAIPRHIRSALQRGLSIDPSDRFPDMAALLAALAPGRTRTPWLAVAAVGLVAATAGGAVAMGVADDPPPPCAAAGQGVDDLWDDRARVRVRDAFAATELAYARDTSGRVVAGLDEYADRLRAGRLAACRATHVRKTQTHDQLGRRSICLDRSARALRATVSRFVRADANTVEYAVEAIDRLPDVTRCEDVEALTLGVQPPSAATALKVSAIRDQLADARAAELAGDYDEARRIADSQMVAAHASGYGPVRVEAAFLLGSLLLVRETDAEVKRGEEHLWDALHLAESHRHDALKVEIWLRLVESALDIARERERGRPWVRQAIATVERLGDRGRLSAQAHWMLGKFHYRNGDMDAAKDTLSYSLTLAEGLSASGAADDVRVGGTGDGAAVSPGVVLAARIRHELANTLRARGKIDAAREQYERALAGWRAAVGERHPKIARLSIDVAGFYEEVGKFERARTLIEAAIEVLREVHGQDHLKVGKAYLILANIEQQQNNLARARELVQSARTIYSSRLPDEHGEMGELWSFAGLIAFREERFADALQAWERALPIQQRALPPGHLSPTFTALNIAEAQVALGRDLDALATLADTADAVVAAAVELPIVAAFADKIRGQALFGLGRHDEALKPLQDALEGLRAQPGYPVELADVLWALARAEERRSRPRLDAATCERARKAQTLYQAQGRSAVSRDIAAWLRRCPPRH